MSQSGANYAAPVPAPASADGLGGTTKDAAGSSRSNVNAAIPPASAPSAHHLVRTGDLSLLVARGAVMSTVARITTITNGLGGYVVSSSLGAGSGGSPATPEPQPLSDQGSSAVGGATTSSTAAGPYATLTVRVPEQDFDAAVSRFADLGTVQSISTSSQDVTSQYVDLQARLSHYRAVEHRLVRFLAATHTIGEMLTVQDRLDRAQLTIEQLSAQLKSLRETTTFGTLSIFVSEKSRHVVSSSKASFGGTLKHSLVLVGRAARASAIALAALLPFLVVFGAIGLAAWYVTRRRRRRRQGAQPTLPA
jgi:hypothetical protein